MTLGKDGQQRGATLPKHSSLSSKTFSKLFGTLFVKLNAEHRFATVSGNVANEISANLCKSASLENITNVQGYGILVIKIYRWRNQPSWDKRFFVLKDSFLLYYAVSEKKLFERSHQISSHPKGVIPISGCYVTACRQCDFEFCIAISHEDFQVSVLIIMGSERVQYENILETNF
ncbi:unnamed protein product [Soboliphyme baturini]|uniref:PH domain-containing protein n=1 Tax=Soboliphyme baturini TaxID=241478 RepID=A0A183ISM0_9BILA|nr:unnamed protein product [Soboliphyme baturini]